MKIITLIIGIIIGLIIALSLISVWYTANSLSLIKNYNVRLSGVEAYITSNINSGEFPETY